MKFFISIGLFFMILSSMAIASANAENSDSGQEYKIVVNFRTARLTLFDGNGEKLFEAAVALPVKSPEKFPIWGRVREIQKPPFWIPTESIREKFAKKGIDLPKVVRPGDKLNEMGAAKIIIDFTTLERTARPATTEPDIGNPSARKPAPAASGS